MKTRAEQIKAGKIWTVHSHESIAPQIAFFEGTRTACIRWLRNNNLFRAYRQGKRVRLGKTIWEEFVPSSAKNQ